MKFSTRPTKLGAEKNFFTKAEDFLDGAREEVKIIQMQLQRLPFMPL